MGDHRLPSYTAIWSRPLALILGYQRIRGSQGRTPNL